MYYLSDDQCNLTQFFYASLLALTIWQNIQPDIIII